MIVKRLFCIIAAIVSIAPTYAQDAMPPPAYTVPDMSYISSHIRYVEYNPDYVINIIGYTGYQMSLEFEPGELIETVGLGDSANWQVTPNGAATVLFLKPLGLGRTTNMSIVTNMRRYNIELQARSGAKVAQSQIVYALRFVYPRKDVPMAPPQASPPPLITAPPELWNRAYSYDGAKGNVPELVFDDGQATYFQFAESGATPAIFSITPDAGESIVNYAVRGPYIVVEQLAPQFVLRQGKDVTFIFNDGYVVPTPGADAPKERPKRKRGLFGTLFGRSSKGKTP